MRRPLPGLSRLKSECCESHSRTRSAGNSTQAAKFRAKRLAFCFDRLAQPRKKTAALSRPLNNRRVDERLPMTSPPPPISATPEQKHEHQNDQDQFHNRLRCCLISGEPIFLINTTALSTFCSPSTQNTLRRRLRPSVKACIDLCGTDFSEQKPEGEHQSSADNHLQDRCRKTSLHEPVSNEDDGQQLESPCRRHRVRSADLK
jgi:hypothetical protein